MATSVQDLLDLIVDAATTAIGDAVAADAAVRALGHLGRALERAADDSEPATRERARRQLTVWELATACRIVAAQWPSASGRVPELAAATADAVARSAPRLDPDQRWAVATEVAVAARHCAESAQRFRPYAEVPALTRVQRLAALVQQVARVDPSGPHGRACLDLPVAAQPVPQRARATDVADAAATLVLAVDRSMRDGDLTMRTALAACAAAESCAQHASAVAGMLAGRSPSAPAYSRVPDSWRLLQATLLRFDDGSRYAAPSASALTEHALALHHTVATLAANHEAIDQVATAMRYVANQLPTIAECVETAVVGWTGTGRLFAKARAMPRSEERVSEFIADRAVIVRPPEIGPVLLVARAAQRQSAALAVELDRTAGYVGRQPQPNLVRALAATLPSQVGISRRANHLPDYAPAAAPAPSR